VVGVRAQASLPAKEVALFAEGHPQQRTTPWVSARPDGFKGTRTIAFASRAAMRCVPLALRTWADVHFCS
jgi:hypothetical protein